MNISRIDGSRYGAVLFSQPSPAASSITRVRVVRVPVRAYDGFIRSIATDLRYTSTSYHHRSPRRPWPPPGLPLSKPFCSAVAPAGGRLPSSNYFTSYPAHVRSWNHTNVSTAEPIEKLKQPHNPVFPEPRVVAQDKDEILSIVDYYDGASVEEYIKLYRDPYLRNYATADGPNITVSDRREDIELQTIDGDQKFVDAKFEPALNLWSALVARRRRPAHVSLDAIWDLYQALPEPRPTHISTSARYLLMSALASGERKDQKSMLRYFAVVADIKNSGFALTSFQWNWAISFASRYVATTTEVELETALQLWRSMEKEAKIRGTEVTFNILFDCASKAGKFTMAEMLYQEMSHRRYAFNRYHHVSLIHFFGLKQDSSGVRAAYREMAEAGEMIDTVVCNCLIASFIRCGEDQSAEHVYEKMKASNPDLYVIPHRDYTMAKAITKVLQMFARVSYKYPSMRSGFQKAVLLSPDLHTYRILINHYGLRLGNLSKVAQYLDEMKGCMVPLNGVIFLALFKSFAAHGGPGSDWGAQRLDSVWDAFLDAMDAGADGLRISTWMAMAALEAHAHYATRDEMLDIYDALRSRWELDETNSQYMLHFLQTLLEKRHWEVDKPPWT
ncbi:hypothetical protein FHL15_004520 [Xylaria flabelliformis]|uniref:Pentacotripeptide-repeat region of PRORP domain-containing protein n=1 Tax=Xylaria flabelliformis TaxID=2512241 RepID=A0A553I2Z5_9PEZI|nr:hypothetical protein FHL15_004520 [Xylaria flabelliformis]